MEVYLRPIEAVVGFDRSGRLSPVRFRIFDDESNWTTVYIKSIVRRRREKIGREFIEIYTCTGLFNGAEKYFELRFEISTCKWSLYRM